MNCAAKLVILSEAYSIFAGVKRVLACNIVASFESAAAAITNFIGSALGIA